MVAAITAISRSTAPAMNVTGSAVEIPNTSLFITSRRAQANPIPMAAPIVPMTSAGLSTNHTIFSCCAPRARLIPIS